MEPYGGCLCIGCLERRIGRKLKPKDFERNHPFNNSGLLCTERLRDRRGDGRSRKIVVASIDAYVARRVKASKRAPHRSRLRRGEEKNSDDAPITNTATAAHC